MVNIRHDLSYLLNLRYQFIGFNYYYFPAESGGENNQDMCIFSYNELRIATQNFSSSNKVGQGGFGTVYKVC